MFGPSAKRARLRLQRDNRVYNDPCGIQELSEDDVDRSVDAGGARTMTSSSAKMPFPSASAALPPAASVLAASALAASASAALPPAPPLPPAGCFAEQFEWGKKILRWFAAHASKEPMHGKLLVVCGPAGCGKYSVVVDAARRYGIPCTRPDMEGFDTFGGVVKYFRSHQQSASLGALFQPVTRSDGLQCCVFFGLEAVTPGEGTVRMPSDESAVVELLRLAKDRRLPYLAVFILNEFPLHMRALRTMQDPQTGLVVTIPASAPDLRASGLERAWFKRQSCSHRLLTVYGQEAQVVNVLLAAGMTAKQALEVRSAGRVSTVPYPCWQVTLPVAPTSLRRMYISVGMGGGALSGVGTRCPLGCGFIGGSQHAVLCNALRAGSGHIKYNPTLRKSLVTITETSTTPCLAHMVLGIHAHVTLLRQEARDDVLQKAKQALDAIQELSDQEALVLARADLQAQVGKLCDGGILDDNDRKAIVAHVLKSDSLPWFPSVVMTPVDSFVAERFVDQDLALDHECDEHSVSTGIVPMPVPMPMPGTASALLVLPPSPERAGLTCLNSCFHALSHCLVGLPDAVFWLLRRPFKNPVEDILPRKVERDTIDKELVQHVLTLFPSLAAQGFWAQYPRALELEVCTHVRMHACMCLFVCCWLYTVEQVQAEGAQPVVVCECLGLGVAVPCRMRRRIHFNCTSSPVPEDRVKRRSKIYAGAQWLVWHSRPCSHGCIPSGWART